jgi:aminopeptidase N
MRLAAFLAALLVASPALAARLTPGGLPSGVVPTGYALSLRPDASRMRFSGEVTTRIRVDRQVRSLVMNAAGLHVRGASIDGRTASFVADPRRESLTIRSAQPLRPGNHVLRIRYDARINTATSGLFAMDSVGADGPHRTLMTNFEPTGARWLMPSWDEPDLKATFTLDLVAPARQMAVSNMPAERSEGMPGGLRRTWFRTSPRMATYLFFLAVGDFERISRRVAGVDLGVVTLKGNSQRCRYALDAAADILPFYNDYFGVPYPLPKLDLVVAPGTIAGIAMENWGAIAYSQNTLFVDERLSTNEDRQGAFNTVAHEMAHQWFGNLVTMRWWDDLWLNEGFASWMEIKTMEHFHADWRPWVVVGAVDRESAMREDSKVSSHPVVQPIETVGQSEETFDSITYKKGQATVQLIERYAGPETFRDGLRAYIKAHSYGSAVSRDFWQAIERSAGKPVNAIADGYTNTVGVPLVEAGPLMGERLTLRQTRFFEQPGRQKAAPLVVPLFVRPAAGGAAEAVAIQGPEPQPVAAPGTGPLVVNAGQRTYARTLYRPAEFEALLPYVARLDADDQLGLVYDQWALGQSGYAPVEDLLEVLKRLPVDAEPGVWRQAIETLEEVDLLHDPGPAREQWRRGLVAFLRPLYLHVGWDPKPDESFNMPLTRSLLLRLLGRIGERDVVAEARRRFALFLADDSALSANLREPVLRIVASQADEADYKRIRRLLERSTDGLEREIYSRVMTSFDRPALVERALEFALSREALAGQGAYLVEDIAVWHPDEAWVYALRHPEKMPRDSETALLFMPDIASKSHRAERADDLARYARSHVPASDRHTSEEAELEIRFRSNVARTVVPRIDAWFAGRAR